MITPDTEIAVYAEHVQFRNACSFGTQVIHVFTASYLPRVTAWVEYAFENERRQGPLTLPLDEVLEFCIIAYERSSRDNHKLRSSLEVLVAITS